MTFYLSMTIKSLLIWILIILILIAIAFVVGFCIGSDGQDEKGIRADVIDKMVHKLETSMPSKLDGKERYGYTVALSIVLEQLKEKK